jgi:flagellar protein FlgJ
MLEPIDRTSPTYINARRQAEEMEGLFLNTLVSQMMQTIGKDSGFDGGFGEETWRSMQAEQFSQAIAESGGIGLADDITEDILAMAGQRVSATPTEAIRAYQGVNS